MTEWIRWTVPGCRLCVDQRTRLRRPIHVRRGGATRRLPVRAPDRAEAGRVWKTGSGGVFVLDHVIGKHLYIDYAVSIEGGRVLRRIGMLSHLRPFER